VIVVSVLTCSPFRISAFCICSNRILFYFIVLTVLLSASFTCLDACCCHELCLPVFNKKTTYLLTYLLRCVADAYQRHSTTGRVSFIEYVSIRANYLIPPGYRDPGIRNSSIPYPGIGKNGPGLQCLGLIAFYSTRTVRMHTLFFPIVRTVYTYVNPEENVRSQLCFFRRRLLGSCRPLYSLVPGMALYSYCRTLFMVEVGRCRYFASVSVFGFLVGFYKSRFGIRYRFFKISDIGSVFFGYPTHVYNYIQLILRSSITTVCPGL